MQPMVDGRLADVEGCVQLRSDAELLDGSERYRFSFEPSQAPNRCLLSAMTGRTAAVWEV